jgi:hypothetical protein
MYIFGLRCQVGSILCWFQFCKNRKKVRQELWACEDIKSVWAKHERREDNFFYHKPIFAGTIMSDQNNTPPHPKGELTFQMQAMTFDGEDEFCDGKCVWQTW